MNVELSWLLPSIIGLSAIFLFLGWYIASRMGQNKISVAEERAREIIDAAEKEAEHIKKEKLLEVKDEWFRKKQDYEKELNRQRNKIHAREKQLTEKEEGIDGRFELLTKKEAAIKQAETRMQEREKDLEDRIERVSHIIAEQTERLERVSGMSRDDARNLLIENMTNDAKLQAAQQLKEIRDEMKSTAKKEAQRVILQAIQRTASDHSVETTVSVLNLASEDMKGRIIGREGRNIRAFEAATGIDVIVDDTPEAVILSGFDPFRREVARIALETLMADGRIHPARIEEVVEKVRKDLEEEIFRVGENTLLDVGIHNAHNEIKKLVGKMKFRSSYGQNLLQHSVEVGWLCGIMAAELGLDPKIATRAGMLHDIGKTLDRNIEGPHALLGMELAKKFREHPIIINAIGSHHDDIPMESPYAPLVQAADAISGARPGARRESLEGYVKRLEKLETIATGFEGVAKTYAIQAGREVRVMVEHDRIDDTLADQLATDIAEKIQNEMEYPGQIKVTVIREKRAIAYAK
ncbi:MAG: ribonuclease Y [Bacteroidota bacterium]|jgi:ribonuclease Y|nr:ribonuclease Y [Bacteroidota bacterium]